MAEGHVEDADRISYFKRHLEQVARVVEKGIPLHGYFAWSLMDNFEWGYGFGKRFGLVHVDFETLKRTPKSSYWWYRDVIGKRAVI
jgi:beta-glucosidase